MNLLVGYLMCNLLFIQFDDSDGDGQAKQNLGRLLFSTERIVAGWLDLCRQFQDVLSWTDWLYLCHDCDFIMFIYYVYYFIITFKWSADWHGLLEFIVFVIVDIDISL